MEHEHSHHTHEHNEHSTNREELLALLEYMVHHNAHHCSELSDLAKEIHGEASNTIADAIKCFEEGNIKLKKALDTMKKGE